MLTEIKSLRCLYSQWRQKESFSVWFIWSFDSWLMLSRIIAWKCLIFNRDLKGHWLTGEYVQCRTLQLFEWSLLLVCLCLIFLHINWGWLCYFYSCFLFLSLFGSHISKIMSLIFYTNWVSMWNSSTTALVQTCSNF